MARFLIKDTNVILVPTTGTGVVLDFTFVILIGSSVPNTGTGVVLDLTFVISIGSSVPTTGTGVVLDLTLVILIFIIIKLNTANTRITSSGRVVTHSSYYYPVLLYYVPCEPDY